MSAHLADDLTCDPQTGSFALTVPLVDATAEPSVEDRLDLVEAQLRWTNHELTDLKTQLTAQTDLLSRLVSILG